MRQHDFSRRLGLALEIGVPTPAGNGAPSPYGAIGRCDDLSEAREPHVFEVVAQLRSRTGERDHLNDWRAVAHNRANAFQGPQGFRKIILLSGLLPSPEVVIGGALSIQTIGDPVRCWCFSPAVDLPAVVENVHAWIRGAGNDQVGEFAIVEGL